MARPALPPAGARGSLRECVKALGQLQETLAVERRQRQQLERDIQASRTALAEAHAALAGTQAGERHARHQALHDSLTLLPNRRFFREQLTKALAQVTPEGPALALLYLDLDKFKPVNDLYGHNAGDELLRIVAARLARAVRAEDSMSRLGGDEFACLPANVISREQLGHLASKLFDTVSAPLKLGTLSMIVRPSIGIALYPADGGTADTLLTSADAAMFRAKRQQTGYAFCDRGRWRRGQTTQVWARAAVTAASVRQRTD
jgi:diguanylate cyclase (GGDEF)-like protein